MLFMDDLKLYGKNNREIESLHRVRVSSEYIRIQFEIEKCATIKLQTDIVENTEGIVPLHAEVIQDVKDGGYK